MLRAWQFVLISATVLSGASNVNKIRMVTLFIFLFMEIELNQGESIQLKQAITTFWNVNSSAGRLSANNGTIVITNQRILLYKVSKTKKFLLGALSSLSE